MIKPIESPDGIMMLVWGDGITVTQVKDADCAKWGAE